MIISFGKGYIYDGPVGPTTELELVAISDQSGQVKWVQKFGQEVKDCREGNEIFQLSTIEKSY